MPTTNLLQGTLDLLILKALALTGLHGLGISHRIAQITNGTFHVKPGSLFPALHRMEEAGWLSSAWGESENKRRAKYYRLTATGRRQLQSETEQWETIALAMASALPAARLPIHGPWQAAVCRGDCRYPQGAPSPVCPVHREPSTSRFS